MYTHEHAIGPPHAPCNASTQRRPGHFTEVRTGFAARAPRLPLPSTPSGGIARTTVPAPRAAERAARTNEHTARTNERAARTNERAALKTAAVVTRGTAGAELPKTVLAPGHQ
jgi:hypothetical protein